MPLAMPSLFLSHGAPTLAIEDGPARRFLSALGASMPKPTAVIVVSAHHSARVPEVTAHPRPPTVHDFGGFPVELFEIEYPAPGDPDLAARIAVSLEREFGAASLHPERGLDHGAWVPLRLMYPDADVPIVQVSIQPFESPAYHLRLGETLGKFRKEGVLIVGSGGATHNLHEFFHGDYSHDSPAPDWVSEFAEWLARHIEAGDQDAVLQAVEIGPHGRQNHPSMDHFLPLFAAMGAGDGAGSQRRIHTSTTYGVLAMDVYQFGA